LLSCITDIKFRVRSVIILCRGTSLCTIAALTESNNYCAMTTVSINIMGAAKWVLPPFVRFIPKTVPPVVRKRKKNQTSRARQSDLDIACFRNSRFGNKIAKLCFSHIPTSGIKSCLLYRVTFFSLNFRAFLNKLFNRWLFDRIDQGATINILNSTMFKICWI